MRPFALFALLAACAEEAPLEALPGDQLPVAPGTPELVASAIEAGQTVRFTLADATPGNTVRFGVSAQLGVGPCGPFFAGDCLDIVAPTLVGVAVADAAGVATLTLTAPPTLPATVHVQAVEQAPRGAYVGQSAVSSRAVGPGICPRIYAPVCGVDGITYGNDCMAYMAGWPIAFTGPCP